MYITLIARHNYNPEKYKKTMHISQLKLFPSFRMVVQVHHICLQSFLMILRGLEQEKYAITYKERSLIPLQGLIYDHVRLYKLKQEILLISQQCRVFISIPSKTGHGINISRFVKADLHGMIVTCYL